MKIIRKLIVLFLFILNCSALIGEDIFERTEKVVLYYYPFGILSRIPHEDSFLKSNYYLKMEFTKELFIDKISIFKVLEGIREKQKQLQRQFDAKVLVEFLNSTDTTLLSIVLGLDYFVKLNNDYYELSEAEYKIFLEILPPLVYDDFQRLKKILDRRDDSIPLMDLLWF
jgi:hypothetical protein